MKNMSLDYSLAGSFSWDIVNEDTLEIEHSGQKNNLILTQGIDYCFQRSFAENMFACALSPLYVTPLKSDTYLQGEFIRTSQTETLSESNLTSTRIASGDAGGGYIYPVQTVTHTKTFRFPAFDVQTQIGTIGISYSASSGQNLFAKSLIGETPISVGQGRYFRLSYSLSITYPSSLNSYIPIVNSGYSTLNYLGYFGPSNIVADPTFIEANNGWNASGWSSSQLVGLMAIGSDGKISPYSEAISGATNMVTGFVTGWNGSQVVLSGLLGTPSGLFSGQACNEPSSGAAIFLSKNGQSPNVTSCSIDRSSSSALVRNSSLTYFGNGVGIKSASFGLNQAITGVYSWGIGGQTLPQKHCGFVYVSTGASYSGSEFITGNPYNGFPGLTKSATGELLMNFYYVVNSV